MLADIKKNEMSFAAKMIEETILGEKFRHRRIKKFTYSKLNMIVKN